MIHLGALPALFLSLDLDVVDLGAPLAWFLSLLEADLGALLAWFLSLLEADLDLVPCPGGGRIAASWILVGELVDLSWVG